MKAKIEEKESILNIEEKLRKELESLGLTLVWFPSSLNKGGDFCMIGADFVKGEPDQLQSKIKEFLKCLKKFGIKRAMIDSTSADVCRGKWWYTIFCRVEWSKIQAVYNCSEVL